MLLFTRYGTQVQQCNSEKVFGALKKCIARLSKPCIPKVI